RGERRQQSHHHALLTLDVFFVVRVSHDDEGSAIRPRRGLDDVRDVALVRRGIEILELLPGILLVTRQIEVRPVVDPLELLPPERKLVLDVVGVLRVMRELLLRMLMPAQLLGSYAETRQPLHALLA